MWGCGLKCDAALESQNRGKVTPYVGVWIEIKQEYLESTSGEVTPYVGVWIEIYMSGTLQSGALRHPLCGGVD